MGARFWEKKKRRIWQRKVKYDVRKVRCGRQSVWMVLFDRRALLQNFADSRIRIKGRFVKKTDEALLLELNNTSQPDLTDLTDLTAPASESDTLLKAEP
jgi:hypothetical protein